MVPGPEIHRQPKILIKHLISELDEQLIDFWWYLREVDILAAKTVAVLSGAKTGAPLVSTQFPPRTLVWFY